jgi:predicted metal-dependent hydrolase
MSTSSPVIRVSDFDVDVVRKDVKNLHVGVYPPFGRVRVAAPPQLDDEAVRLAVVSRLAWIQKKRSQVRNQARQSRREMISGETHYVWGRPLRLHVVEDGRRQRPQIRSDRRLELHVRPGAGREARERQLTEWYRRELKEATPPIIGRWAPILEVDRPEWTVRRMKTKWGTCDPDKARITLNLELAKKAPECLEYIVVHEMVHLLEKNHTERYYELMTQYMPNWQLIREELNRAPLAHEIWKQNGVNGQRGSAPTSR